MGVAPSGARTKHSALGYQTPEEFAARAAARGASFPTPLGPLSPGVDFNPGTRIMIGPKNGGRSVTLAETTPFKKYAFSREWH